MKLYNIPLRYFNIYNAMKNEIRPSEKFELLILILENI